MIQVRIKENAFVARLAAAKLRSASVAIVFGRTIYLWNATAEELLKNERWLKHEAAHIHQYKREGFIRFLAKYFWLWLRMGYKNHPFELEASEAEKDPNVLNALEFVGHKQPQF